MFQPLDDFIWQSRGKFCLTKIARELGINYGNFSRYVHGKKVPPVKLAKKLERLTDGAVNAYDFIEHAWRINHTDK